MLLYFFIQQTDTYASPGARLVIVVDNHAAAQRRAMPLASLVAKNLNTLNTI